ncbi:MAG: LLM class flavin-dependent oxidoreductase, partial [Actinomycetota bacterium]|nr:LLM class flavin-dependent oxidoreductase [Actinomycetota bacterium]
MRIGITVAQSDRLANPAAVAAAVSAAEQLGYSSVWVCDSALDPAGVLSAAATVKGRVGLGAGIVVGEREDPVSLARALTKLDILSDGRLSVVLGGHDEALDAVLDVVAAGCPPVFLDGRSPSALDRVARRAA